MSQHVTFADLIPSCPAGLILEFGVFRGDTFRQICEVAKPRLAYGFDWFWGLPEPWEGSAPGLYSADGELPEIPDNGRLVVGRIEDTLLPFLTEHSEPVSLVHFDLDIYAPTKFALDHLRFQMGSILVFDEICGRPELVENEQRAFWQWFVANQFSVKFLGCTSGNSWVLQIVEPHAAHAFSLHSLTKRLLID